MLRSLLRALLNLAGSRRRPRQVVRPEPWARAAPTRVERPIIPRGTPKSLAGTADEMRRRISNLPQFRILWVIDGDTVIASNGRSELKIRLDSIDCPEDGQHWGDIAKYGLIKLIGRQQVNLEVHGVDAHGRTLATVYVWHQSKEEWLNVNERMVTLGHAWVMRRFYDHLPKDRQNQLNRLERWAQSKEVGLWGTPNPIPPWQWRNGR